jgi:citrate synthase
MLPLRSYGLDINVDFYSGVIYEQLGIPVDLFVPIFVAARMPGWLAHIGEQRTDNILIRPLLRYIGATDRRLPETSVHHAV